MENYGPRVSKSSRSLPDRRQSAGPLLALAAVIVALGGRFFLVISRYSINVFYLDQWEYLTPFFRHQPSVAELFFWQHGPHREGLGLLPDIFLFPLTHWNARVDAFIVGGGIFAAMLLALLLKYKLFGRVEYSDVSIPLIFLTLQQSEAMVGTPNPAYSAFPLMLIMLYCLALRVQNRLLRYSLLVGLNFLLIYTGMGLFMGVVTIAVFLIESYRNWRYATSIAFGEAMVGWVASIGSLASCFFHYTFSPYADCFEIPRRHLLQYLELTALMFAAFAVPRPLHVSWRMAFLGVAILLAFVAVLGSYLVRLMRNTGHKRELIGAVLLSYSLLFSANAAIGRLCLGLEMAFSSRYVTLLIPAFLAIYFFLLSKSWRGQRSLVLGLWVLLLLPGAVRKPWEVQWYSTGKRNWANCYVRTENIHYCDQSANFAVHNSFEEIGLQEKLDYLKQHQPELVLSTSS